MLFEDADIISYIIVFTCICIYQFSTQCVHLYLCVFHTMCTVCPLVYVSLFHTVCSLCTYQFCHTVYPFIFVLAIFPHNVFIVYLSVCHSVYLLIYVPAILPNNVFIVYLPVFSHCVSTYICTYQYSTLFVHCVLISFVT